jgi:hypothetical protein
MGSRVQLLTFFEKMESPRPEMDVKWYSTVRHIYKMLLRFSQSFSPRFVLKLAKFDAEFESVEKNAKNHPKEVIGRKIFFP